MADGRHPPDGLRGREAQAATRCASRKRWFCAYYVCTVLVEQRGDRGETPGHRDLLGTFAEPRADLSGLCKLPEATHRDLTVGRFQVALRASKEERDGFLQR
jgi:hypothetical protein